MNYTIVEQAKIKHSVINCKVLPALLIKTARAAAGL